MTSSILLDTPSKQFERHLLIENNNRILFSGPFGIGKTTFIKKFFSERKNCVTITLRPVNYAVASNEDIFKLIKYDLLYQLLAKELIMVEDFGKFSKLEIFQHFVTNVDIELIAPFIETIPYIGGEVTKAILALDKLRKKFKSDKEQLNTNQDEKAINTFINKSKEHYLLENDFITEIIKETISRINSDPEKSTVLIIDDLDRIDPEHIFRLFNIFSTHFDYNHESDNKFGFKKIIFICDHKNIQFIFQAKYGISTDFNGYIDKFYSTEIFMYNNHAAITSFIADSLSVTPRSSFLSRRDIEFLVEILTSMLEYNVINLRSIIKTLQIHEANRIDIESKKGNRRFEKYCFTKVAYTLKHIIDSSDALTEY